MEPVPETDCSLRLNVLYQSLSATIGCPMRNILIVFEVRIAQAFVCNKFLRAGTNPVDERSHHPILAFTHRRVTSGEIARLGGTLYTM